jgi:hypothetical protein
MRHQYIADYDDQAKRRMFLFEENKFSRFLLVFDLVLSIDLHILTIDDKVDRIFDLLNLHREHQYLISLMKQHSYLNLLKIDKKIMNKILIRINLHDRFICIAAAIGFKGWTVGVSGSDTVDVLTIASGLNLTVKKNK